MQINPEILAIIKNLLKEANVPIQDGQFDTMVAMINQLLEQSDASSKELEAHMGPERWAKYKAELDAGLEKITADFTARMQQIADSMETGNKL